MAIKVDFKELDIELDFMSLLKQTGEETANMLSEKAPKDKGTYASGFNSQVIGNDNNAKAVIYNDSKEGSLSHILEFGTPTMPPQPHYRTTYDTMEKRFLDKMQKTEIKIK